MLFAHKKQSRMNRIIFIQIQNYDELYVYRLLAIYCMRWKDYSEGEEWHKISKHPN